MGKSWLFLQNGLAPVKGAKWNMKCRRQSRRKFFEKYKLLSPDFRFFLLMISQKFGGSGSRYILSFPNLSTEKSCSAFIFSSGCNLRLEPRGADFRRRISRKVDTFGRREKCTSPVSRLRREQRLSFSSLKLFSLVGCHFSCTCLTFGLPSV